MRRYPESAARSGFMVCASRAGAVDNAQFDSLWRTPRIRILDDEFGPTFRDFPFVTRKWFNAGQKFDPAGIR